MQTGVKVPRPPSVKLLLALCLLAGLGCGGGSEKVVSVRGKVTHNNQPVAGLVVSFVPQATTETGVSTGKTDNNGEYELTVAKSNKRGAVVGTHKVWVSVPREPPKLVDKEERLKLRRQGKRASAGTSLTDLKEILKKYGKLDNTPLTVEVTGDQPIDLNLE
jgi:hypothetical protein